MKKLIVAVAAVATMIAGSVDVASAQSRRHGGGPAFHHGGGHGYHGVSRHRGGYYYRGHRGYRHYRPGYRRHGDWWFPAAAFGVGALIGGAIASQPTYAAPPPDDAHVRWCYGQYKSYRASDNTFQPYNGPRQACVSPYGG